MTRNLGLYALLKSLDGFARLVAPAAPAPFSFPAPRRILFSNGAHLGDALLSTSVLPVIKELFPEAKIGFAGGSWSSVVFRKHPAVTWVHTIDHWRLNRSEESHRTKFLRYFRSRRKALQEIKNLQYDVFVDLYPYFPNMIGLAWKAGIPIRVGYGSGGLGPLLTHCLSWRNLNQPIFAYHARLLEVLPGVPPGIEVTQYDLGLDKQTLEKKIAEVAFRERVATGNYVVFHPGAGSSLREWPLEKWRELAGCLSRDNVQIFIVGQGQRQEAIAAGIAKGISGVRSLCGRLAWDELVSVISGARLLVGLDSVCGHLAAALGIPAVVLMTGMNNAHHWAPMGASVVTQEVPCAPCFQSKGCTPMTCIKEIPFEKVTVAVQKLMDVK